MKRRENTKDSVKLFEREEKEETKTYVLYRDNNSNCVHFVYCQMSVLAAPVSKSGEKKNIFYLEIFFFLVFVNL